VSVVLAVLAAGANATGSVLQRLRVRRYHDRPMSVWVLWHLVRQPIWVLGVIAMLTGLLLQAGALATGPIVLIQPIMICELGFALLLSGLAFGTRLSAREWWYVAGTGAGVALLLIALAPDGGHPLRAATADWAVGCVLTVALVALLVTAGHRNRHAHRAALLGVAAGVWFAFSAALLSAITAGFAIGGGAAVFSTWQTYVLLVAGPAGFFLLQDMLRAGRLEASQPGLVLANPLAAIGWGVVVFGENVRGGGWIAAEVIAALVVGVCTVLLARSPLLEDRTTVAVAARPRHR
jgi:hypothetical protein